MEKIKLVWDWENKTSYESAQKKTSLSLRKKALAWEETKKAWFWEIETSLSLRKTKQVWVCPKQNELWIWAKIKGELEQKTKQAYCVIERKWNKHEFEKK